MNTYTEWLISIQIIVGTFFMFVGSFGLIKLPNLISRLHGPSKATTLGLGGCLIASMVHFGTQPGNLSIQELLITFFLFITAPVTAHFIAKAYLHLDMEPGGLPKAQDDRGWHTYVDIPEHEGQGRDHMGSRTTDKHHPS